MNDQQKIELANFISDVHFRLYGQYGNGRIPDDENIGMSDKILNKISELKAEHDPLTSCDCGGELVDTKSCGVCAQAYCQSCLSDNFKICSLCESKGLKLNSCEDKNGKKFYPGEWLKSEHSNTWVQVLRIGYDFIASSVGAVEREDFVQAGWIVHERVTPFKIGGMNMGITECKFKDCMIGSAQCRFKCPENKGESYAQNWVICKLYNDEAK